MAPVSHATFDAFFRSRYRDLVRFVMALGASLHDAEEVSQDAMSAAYERWDRISDPPAWTWRVASRAYLRLHRRRRRHETLLPAAQLAEQPGRPRSHTARPEDDVISSDQVRRLLRGLASQQRRVVAWWLIGCRFEEIAQRLDIATSTARSLFRKARERLALRLGDLRAAVRDESPKPRRRRRP